MLHVSFLFSLFTLVCCTYIHTERERENKNAYNVLMCVYIEPLAFFFFPMVGETVNCNSHPASSSRAADRSNAVTVCYLYIVLLPPSRRLIKSFGRCRSVRLSSFLVSDDINSHAEFKRVIREIRGRR